MLTSELTGATRLIPVLGHPISHVRAPRAYNPAFEAAGLDWCQIPLDVHPDDLAATLAQLARMENVLGLNITIPHKAAACALCSRVGPEAQRTGVVNTLRRETDGTWAGESFDGAGFVTAARHHGMLRPQQPVLIVGTGGAGTAIAFALAAAGVKDLVLVNREPARAQALARALRESDAQVRVRFGMEHAREVGLAVNATSLGLHASAALPFDPSALQPGTAVFDIIAAHDTELMAASRALGLPTLGGRPMIEHQVAAQIAFWRGEPHSLKSPT